MQSICNKLNNLSSNDLSSSSEKSFENIPVCFGAYYDTELAKSHSWIITEKELAENRSTGYVEVGYRIRKYIFENNLLSENWKTDATSYGNCYFKNSNGDMMGVHYVAGSHRRWNGVSKKEIRDILSLEYSDYKKLSVCLCCGSSNLDLILVVPKCFLTIFSTVLGLNFLQLNTSM